VSGEVDGNAVAEIESCVVDCLAGGPVELIEGPVENVPGAGCEGRREAHVVAAEVVVDVCLVAWYGADGRVMVAVVDYRAACPIGGCVGKCIPLVIAVEAGVVVLSSSCICSIWHTASDIPAE